MKKDFKFIIFSEKNNYSILCNLILSVPVKCKTSMYFKG